MKYYEVTGGKPCILSDNGKTCYYIYKDGSRGGPYPRESCDHVWKNEKEIEYPADFPEKWKLGDKSPKTPANYFYTEYSEEVWALAAKWIENTGYTVGGDEGRKGIILNTEGKIIWKSSLEFSSLGTMGEKLEPLEFLAKIRNLPEKKKIEINILPWPVIIEGESVRVGCQTVSLERLKEVIEKIDEDKTVIFNGYELNPRRNCLAVYGESNISWEKWDEFRAELKKQEIIS